MLARLRRKIVAIVMGVSGAVLVLSFVAMLAMNYASAYGQVHESLRAAVERGPVVDMLFKVGRAGAQARAPLDVRDDASGADADDAAADGKGGRGRDVFAGGGGLTPCAVFLVDDEGTILEDNGTFVTMDSQTAATALAESVTSADEEGYIADADVYYLRQVGAEGTVVVAFADALAVREQLVRLAVSMGLIGAGVLLLLLAASVLLARVATRPVETAWEQQRRFVADASHELKTPLTVILANADILADDAALTSDQAKWVESTQDEAGRMKGLIEEMLTLAQSDETADQARAAFTDVDLTETVMRSCLAFDAVAFEAGVTIADDVAPGMRVTGDPAQLERLVKILVDNAVKYAGEGGAVDVRLAAQKGRPLLAVRNSGPVIPASQLPHVFERFWRSDAAHTRTERGSYGLGLAIAKSIADAHGADIAVTSEEGSGTEFSVVFPAQRGSR